MMSSMHRLTMVTLLLAAAMTANAQQPGGQSVLSPESQPMPMDPMAIAPPMGSVPYGQDPAFQPDGYEGFPGDCACEGGCEMCDDGSWALGPRRPRVCGLWGSLDALLWWNKGRYVPALVTTSDPADRGVLGAPSTDILFGQEHIGSDAQWGGRLNIGTWLNPQRQAGLGFRFLALAGDETEFNAASDGSTVLARPFMNASINAEDALLIGLPGSNSGDINIGSDHDFFTTEVFGRFHMHGDGYFQRIDLMAGYQFARIDDSLRIESNTTILDPLSPIVGATFNVLDDFRTENEFHGALLGLMGEHRNGRAKISWMGKLGLGSMRQQSTIAGESLLTLGGGGGTIPINGGLFAQGTNIGTYESTRFCFVPEFDLNLHYQLTPRIDVSVGYSIMYFTSVALAGDQIDRTVNLTQQSGPIVGPARPEPNFEVTDFWYQGLNFGLGWTF